MNKAALNSKKSINLTSLYDVFIDSIKLGYLYINYERYGAPRFFLKGEVKHKMLVDNSSVKGATIIFLDYKYRWVIRKYGA